MLTIKKSELLAALQNVIDVVPARSTQQVLQNIRITLSPDSNEIKATSPDMNVYTTTGEGKSDNDDEFLINAKQLHAIVGVLPEGDVEFKRVKSEILIKSGETEFKLPITGVELWPEGMSIEKETLSLELDKKDFETMINSVSFAVASDTSRPMLRGILFEAEGAELKVVATDSRQFGLYKVVNSTPVDKKHSHVLYPKACEQIIKIAKDNDKIKMRVGADGQGYATVEFSSGNNVVLARTVGENYPDIQSLLGKVYNKTAIINCTELTEVARRIAVIANEKTRMIKLIFNPNRLEIRSDNRDFGGSGKASIGIKYDNEPITIGINVDYLLDVLKRLGDQDIKLGFNDDIGQMGLCPKENDAMSFIIMPVRITEES